jgi:hypothetical protein
MSGTSSAERAEGCAPASTQEGKRLMPGHLIRSTPGLPLDLSEVERFALRNLLAKTIETSRYPLSRRILTLKAILAKLVPILSAAGPRSRRPQKH